jgi:DNA-binding CsgD family transcriptional regulator
MRSTFVGRDQEFRALHDSLDDALHRRPRIVLCQGEPGIGKTRMGEELLTLAAERDVATAWGIAVDGSGTPPYWPWRQVLRAIGNVIDLPALSDRYRLKQDLSRLAPDIFTGRDDVSATGETSADRFRRFDAVGRLLRQVTLQRPFVIVLDDMHWADHASLLLLQHLGRTLSNEPLLLMVSYRDTEHTHAAVFAELLREPVTREVHLGGLSAEGVARQLETIVGSDVADDDARRIHQLTGGNPYFVQEMGRVLRDRKAGLSSPAVPASVLDAIAGRLARLTPASVTLLRAGSIIGRDFSTAVVAAMLALPVPECLAPLDEACAAGLVEPGDSPGEHRFAHALIRDAIAAGLSTPERLRLHRRAADTIEERYATDLSQHLFDLARHWTFAAVQGDQLRASGWIERAGEEAMRRLGYEEGARLFRLAIDVGGGELDEICRCRLLLATARALFRSGEIAACVDTCAEAATRAARIGRADLMAQAALVPEAVGPSATEATTRRLCADALAVVDPDQIAVRARLTARLAEASIYVAWWREHGTEDYVVAGSASAQALDLAERGGDAAALDAALRARRLACSGPDGIDERMGLAERMLSLGRATADPVTQMWSHLWSIDVAFERGDLTRVGREVESLSWCADQIQGPIARFHLLTSQAVLAQARGRFADAIRLVHEAFAAVAWTAEHSQGFFLRAGLLQLVGHHIGHQASGSVQASGYGDATVFDRPLPTAGVIVAVANAHLLAEVGRLDEAAAVYRSLGPVAAWTPSPHAILPALAFGMDLAMVVGSRDDVELLHDRLAVYRGRHVATGAGQVAYEGPAELCLGRAARYLNRLDDAVTDLEHAAATCVANGAPGFQTEAEYELGAALVRRSQPGDHTRARSVLTECASRARSLGMKPFEAKASTLLDELGDRRPSLLTPREHEIAGLVAQGLTNREIAERLVLSERTAQNHVQHILIKLALSNRSQIAVWFTAGRNEYRD